jgi:hypothetical protein
MRFRLRSLTRDENADARRLSSIKRSFCIAIAEAMSEKEGLQRRLDSARQPASMLLDNETSDYINREPESERLLLEAERNLIAAPSKKAKKT